MMAQQIPVSPPKDALQTAFEAYVNHYQAERVYIQTDRPFYNPGETVWFTVFVRDERSLKPAPNSEVVQVELLDPKGATSKELRLPVNQGVATAQLDLDDTAPGGIYTLRAHTRWQQNDLQPEQYFTKTLTVQKVVLPRVRMKVDFVEKAYGPGQKVNLKFEAKTLDDRPLANVNLKLVQRYDGTVQPPLAFKTDSKGEALITFTLPAKLATADGLATISFQHEGQTEAISRSIPIVLNKLSLKLYPEGGALVAGLAGRLAFEARNEFGKPADITGNLVDKTGKVVAQVASFHQGMGAVAFTPEPGQSYFIQLTNPTTQKFEVPEAIASGRSVVVQQSQKGELVLDVHASNGGGSFVLVHIRGEVVHAQRLAPQATHRLSLPTRTWPTGVAHITVFDANGLPRAERLAFVNYDRQARLELTTTQPSYSPRQNVELKLKATTPDGEPIAGKFAVAVADDKLLAFADDRQGNLLSVMLLEHDLNGPVEESFFYFDPKEKDKAPQALDYLLMTRGWRRFQWEKLLETKKLPDLAHQPELRVIGGRVSHARNPNFQAAGQEVRLIVNNIVKRTVKTDAQGRFVFSDLDALLSEPAPVLIATSFGRELGSVREEPVTAFGTDYKLDYYTSPRSSTFIGRAFDAMGAAAIEGAEEGGEEEFGEDDGGMDEQPAPNIRTKRAERAPVQMAAARAEPVQAPRPGIPAKPNEPDRLGQPERPALDLKFGQNMKVLDAGAPVPKREEQEDVAPEPEIVHLAALFTLPREFAVPVYNPNSQPELRTDFRSTIFWKGILETDRNGLAKCTFPTSDAVTTFRITAEGFTALGQPARAEHTFASVLPFSMDVKVPPVVTFGDRVEVPLALKNTTATGQTGSLTFTLPTGWKPASLLPTTVSLAPNEAKTLYLAFDIQNNVGTQPFGVAFKSTQASDAFQQPVTIVAKGFPVQVNLTGQNLTNTHQVLVKDLIPGSLTATVVAYPNPLSEMLTGLDNMLREPYGCFEQTSSSTYPNIMVLQYLKENGVNDEKLLNRALALIDKGYKRLIGFETPAKGFEWFGHAPGHEALTAYGLLEYTDMARVYDKVDPVMVKRTVDWMLARRDGKGGFIRNPKALDAFGAADQDIANAYIAYALSEAGCQGFETELNATTTYALASKDPYLLALALNTARNLKTPKAAELEAALLATRKPSGTWTGKKHSITFSTGQGLEVETSALAVLALLKSPQPNRTILTEAVKGLLALRTGWNGGYGNTQATVLALKALTQYTRFMKQTEESGSIEVYVDGKLAAKTAYAKGHVGAITVPIDAKYLTQGTRNVEVRYAQTKTPLPYSLQVHYTTNLPVNSPECVLSLTTRLASEPVALGQTSRCTIELRNTQSKGQPMSLAVVGIPAGLSPQPWQLKELQEKKVFDFYEIYDNRLALYYRSLEPNAVKTIHLDLKADVPGQYEAPASTAYLYYTAEHRVWAKPERLTIAP
jgi:hypothetical protein